MMNWYRLTQAERYEATEKARKAIDHGCDGPITPFVLIARACDVASRGDCHAHAVADALHEALESRRWLRDDDDAFERTGS